MALHFKKAIDLATELNRDANHDEFYQGKNFMVKINGTTNYAEILVLDKGKQVQTLTPDMVNKWLTNSLKNILPCGRCHKRY
jgi:hypothetical protein